MGYFMRRIILVFSVIFLGIITITTGCGREKNVSIDELIKINDKIIEYFQTHDKYSNFSYNYVDESNLVVVVGLVDNSKEEQSWFRKNVVDSKYIKFEQGEHYNDGFDVAKNIDIIVNNGPQMSSNPFDYIKASQKEYDELLEHSKETFEYSIKDLIETNAGNGLKSYIEALLCSEINDNFKYDFESANDYLDHYKKFLNDDNHFNQYDEYAVTLLKQFILDLVFYFQVLFYMLLY